MRPALPHRALCQACDLLAILTLAISFLLTPLSRPIWNHLPELRLPAIPLAAPRHPRRRSCPCHRASALAPLKLQSTPQRSPQAPRPRPRSRSSQAPTPPSIRSATPDDRPRASQHLFHSNHGTEPTDEYTPVTADNDALAPEQSRLLALSTTRSPQPRPTPRPPPPRHTSA